MEISEKRKHFEAFWKYLKNSKDFEKLSMRELAWKIYNQACADCGQGSSEVSIEETQKFIEDVLFFDFIQDCLLNPKSNSITEHNDYVKVVYECSPSDRDKCIAWPDRCDDACNGHTAIINLSKLCGINSDNKETITDKILSTEEVNQLSKALQEAENAKN
jgi:hypothetical protein